MSEDDYSCFTCGFVVPADRGNREHSCAAVLAPKYADVMKELGRLRAENAELHAAKDLLFWWAERMSNAPEGELPEVIRTGYQRIINLVNVLKPSSIKVMEASTDE